MCAYTCGHFVLTDSLAHKNYCLMEIGLGLESENLVGILVKP